MRISDWSSDVCSSDLLPGQEENIRSGRGDFAGEQGIRQWGGLLKIDRSSEAGILSLLSAYRAERSYNSEDIDRTAASLFAYSASQKTWATRSEEHTSELQSLMRISYAVFCLKKKKT